MTTELRAYVNSGDEWVDGLARKFIISFCRKAGIPFTFVARPDDTDGSESLFYQFCGVEDVDVRSIHRASPSHMISLYPNVDCWTRKNRLANLARYWSAKNPSSILKTNVPESVNLEIDYSEFLDECLDAADSCDLRTSLQANSEKTPEERAEWWIVKPALTDCGYGIHVVSTLSELSNCFESVDTCERESNSGEGEALETRSSQLREYVVQRYIHPVPLIDGRKFHVRAYVLAVGRLQVLVHNELLAIVAPVEYQDPWHPESLKSGLTNTSLQASSQKHLNRRSFWNLPDNTVDSKPSWKADVFKKICRISGDIFRAGVETTASRLSHHPSCFEMFALDFQLDQDGEPWLLEVNSGPAINKIGESGQIMKHFFASLIFTTLRKLTRYDEIFDAENGWHEAFNEDRGSTIPSNSACTNVANMGISPTNDVQ